ncbi:hypothetical protein [Alteromonas sp. 14N.309.X.WAT.G.H12]|uniref:hypothetical protein n=1 Tax=Alteromonas sp. 14N.309.X.WAT.G.H12 TaxID=3120824 RepID=UPI002FD48B44
MNAKSSKAITSIGKSIANINKQLEALKEEYPDAMMYVEDGTQYNVMSGRPHVDVGLSLPERRPDRILATFYVNHSECGAW